VTLVEPNESYVACPLSNLVVAGHRTLERQTFSYAVLAKEGIEVRRTPATDVDAVARTVTLEAGESLAYDRLILAPGIDFRWGALEGYGPESVERMPHAWKAGPQTLLLQRQLVSMADGGVVVMSVTAAPFRCPPGPYERASLIAHYLAQHKPRSKLIVLDSNDKFSKQPLFTKVWSERYASILEWRGASNDGRVVRVDPNAMTLDTDFESVRGDVVNVVPPQQAGLIAQRAGTTDSSGWCPVDASSFESHLQRGIHVIGDATIAAPMPKSAFAANAHVCTRPAAERSPKFRAPAASVRSTPLRRSVRVRRTRPPIGSARSHGRRFCREVCVDDPSFVDARALRERLDRRRRRFDDRTARRGTRQRRGGARDLRRSLQRSLRAVSSRGGSRRTVPR
jgi:NADPH-dependent 2,4-dienoyl-CoA reductase/sulfur reductase-like enzyme